MWQDLVLSMIGIIFTIVLLPQLYDTIKKRTELNPITTAITGIGCGIIGCIDLTLNLPLSSIVSFTTSIIWIMLLIFSSPYCNKWINTNYFSDL